MNTYDDLGTYNGDFEHDIWGDFYSFENIGIPDVFDESDLDNYLNNLND